MLSIYHAYYVHYTVYFEFYDNIATDTADKNGRTEAQNIKRSNIFEGVYNPCIR